MNKRKSITQLTKEIQGNMKKKKYEETVQCHRCLKFEHYDPENLTTAFLNRWGVRGGGVARKWYCIECFEKTRRKKD